MSAEDEHENSPMDCGPDSPAEWDFDPVPDSELIACCFWEYARESKSIKMRADLHWCLVRRIQHRDVYARDPALAEQHALEAQRIEERAKQMGLKSDDFADRYWETDFPYIRIYESVTHLVCNGVKPWQRIPAEIRDRLAREAQESDILRPLSPARVGELEELWKANSAEILEIRGRPRDEMDDSEDLAMCEASKPIEPSNGGEEADHANLTAALTVDFSRFTDREIVEAFQLWLKEWRPKQWKRPRRVIPGARQRGRKLVEFRVALERLGLMRLLHWHSPSDLRNRLPDAWRKVGRKEQDLRREIREAARFFRAIFPFLPETERPESETRFGVWMPEMLKVADEVAREMGLDGGQ